jgi:hypothetical protein
MSTLTADALRDALAAHALWLGTGDEDGERADLRRADLSGACLDYSSWPLWCGSGGARTDALIAAQLAAHLCALDCDDEAYLAAREALLPFARTSHRAGDLGLSDDERGE